MKNIFTLFLTTFLFSTLTIAQGYQIGDEAANFTLKNIDDTTVSLTDYKTEKGVIVIFTCNHCPYSVAYEDPINAIDQKYKALGYPVVAINPNDPDLYPSDSFEAMKVRAEEKSFSFPYLMDANQNVFPAYGATKTPHVYVLQNDSEKFNVAYIGAIDNNSLSEEDVTKSYLMDALDALIAGDEVEVPVMKAIGCSIKVKK